MNVLAKKDDICNRLPVGRPRINGEQTPARFRDGTLARIDAVLAEGEKRSDFIREAVETEVKRRERKPR